MIVTHSKSNFSAMKAFECFNIDIYIPQSDSIAVSLNLKNYTGYDFMWLGCLELTLALYYFDLSYLRFIISAAIHAELYLWKCLDINCLKVL